MLTASRCSPKIIVAKPAMTHRMVDSAEQNVTVFKYTSTSTTWTKSLKYVLLLLSINAAIVHGAAAHDVFIQSRISDDLFVTLGVATLSVDDSRARLQIVVPLPSRYNMAITTVRISRHVAELPDVVAVDLLSHAILGNSEIQGVYNIDPVLGAALVDVEDAHSYYVEVSRVTDYANPSIRRRAASPTPITFVGAINYFNQSVCGFIDAAAVLPIGQVRDLFGNVRNPLSQAERSTCHMPNPSNIVCEGVGSTPGRFGWCTCDTDDPKECADVAMACTSGISLPGGGGIGFNCSPP